MEIIADIIKLCRTEIRKTALMYAASLSHRQLTRYVVELQENRLIEKATVGGTTYYRITAKGEDFLVTFEKLRETIEVRKEQPIYERYSSARV